MRRLFILAAMVLTQAAFAQCKIDFNNDGVFPSEQDTIDFANVLAGGECSTGNCDSIDFNQNGVFPEDQDVTDFYAVLAGGPCSNGGWTPSRTPGPTVTVGLRDSLQAVYQSLRWSGGTILIPYSSRPDGVYNETVRWNDQDGMPYGNITVRGVPSEEGDRPIIRPPTVSSAGFRIGAANVSVYGVQIECPHCGAGIDITGNAANVLVEDVVIVGGANGVRVQGNNQNGGDVRIRRSIMRFTRNDEGHSQGVYVAGWKHMVLVEGCVFDDIGDKTTYNQGIYWVHGPGVRIAIDNWFRDPGFAGIQARGSDSEYTIRGNVFEKCGNSIGVGHPMGVVYNVRGVIANNLIINPKPPYWGIALQNGDGAIVTGNIMLAIGAGYAFQIENPSRSLVVKGNTISRWDRVRNYARGVSAANDGISWEGDTIETKPIPATNWPELLARKSGEWNDEKHGTAATIERAK